MSVGHIPFYLVVPHCTYGKLNTFIFEHPGGTGEGFLLLCEPAVRIFAEIVDTTAPSEARIAVYLYRLVILSKAQ
jgi:hypothetical protein